GAVVVREEGHEATAVRRDRRGIRAADDRSPAGSREIPGGQPAWVPDAGRPCHQVLAREADERALVGAAQDHRRGAWSNQVEDAGQAGEIGARLDGEKVARTVAGEARAEDLPDLGRERPGEWRGDEPGRQARAAPGDPERAEVGPRVTGHDVGEDRAVVRIDDRVADDVGAL